jgi:hypothetical protein
MTKMKTKLISAFPGTGKSHFYRNSHKKVLDSDSSTFDKSEFPGNYIAHIKENQGEVDIIFISSHKEVRDALVANKLEFVLVYPTRDQKQDYIQRYIDRGSPQPFIDLLSKNWDDWIDELQVQECCTHMQLNPGEYMSDALG